MRTCLSILVHSKCFDIMTLHIQNTKSDMILLGKNKIDIRICIRRIWNDGRQKMLRCTQLWIISCSRCFIENDIFITGFIGYKRRSEEKASHQSSFRPRLQPLEDHLDYWGYHWYYRKWHKHGWSLPVPKQCIS